MSQTLSESIDKYMNFRRTAYSRGTALASEQTMRQFLAAVGNVQTKGLQPKHAERFQSRLLQSGKKPHTVNSRMAQLSAFSKWAVANRIVPANFVGTTRTVPVPRKAKLRIPASDFARVLDCAYRPDHRIVVALGLFLYLRGGEIKTLRVRDVDLDAGKVDVVIHKTNDWDEMPICWELDQELRRWLTEYSRDIGRPLHGDDYLVPQHKRFLGWRPRPTSGNFEPSVPILRPYHHVQDVLERAGYIVSENEKRTGEGVHTLRRSGARFLYDGLVEGRFGDPSARDDALRQTMSALHHAHSRTTEIYLGLEHDRQKRDRSMRGVKMLPDYSENVISLKEAK